MIQPWRQSLNLSLGLMTQAPAHESWNLVTASAESNLPAAETNGTPPTQHLSSQRLITWWQAIFLIPLNLEEAAIKIGWNLHLF